MGLRLGFHGWPASRRIISPLASASRLPSGSRSSALTNAFQAATNVHVLNSFTLQPFINYNLAHAWAISTAPEFTADWSAREGSRWTVPIGLGVSKIAHVAEQPLNFELQYYHNVKHPDRAGSNQLRLEVAALWPTAAAMAQRKKEEEMAKAKAKAAERKTRQGSSP